MSRGDLGARDDDRPLTTILAKESGDDRDLQTLAPTLQALFSEILQPDRITPSFLFCLSVYPCSLDVFEGKPMNEDRAKELLGYKSENLPHAFYAPIPRCVINDHDLKDSEFRVYSYLIARCNSDLPITWVSQETIGRDLNRAPSNVSRAIRALVVRGLIKKARDRNGGCTYQIVEAVKVYGEEEARKPWERFDPTYQKRKSDDPTYQKRKSDISETQVGHIRNASKEAEPQEAETMNQNTHRETPDFVVQAEAEAAYGGVCVEQQLPRIGSLELVASKVDLTASELKLGQQWLDHALSQHRADGGLTVPRTWTCEVFARDIVRLKQAASLNDLEVAMLIKFIPDDKVWSMQAMRPGILLDASKSNGRLKIHNLIAKARQSKQVKAVQDDVRIAAIQEARRAKAKAEGRL